MTGHGRKLSDGQSSPGRFSSAPTVACRREAVPEWHASRWWERMDTRVALAWLPFCILGCGDVAGGTADARNDALRTGVDAGREASRGRDGSVPRDSGHPEMDATLPRPDAPSFDAPSSVREASSFDADHDAGTDTGDGRVACVETCGGTCTSTGCLVTLASIPPYANAIALDGTEVFWLTADRLMAVPKIGGTAVTLAEQPGLTLSALALDATHVYWTGGLAISPPNGVVAALRKDGGSPSTLAAGQEAPSSIAVDPSSVYWTTGLNDADSGTVMKRAVDGGGLVALVAQQTFPDNVAVDTARVYWTTGLVSDAGTGTVESRTMDGGVLATIATEQGRPSSLLVAGGSLFWTDERAGTVVTAPTSGGATTTLATGQEHPYGIALSNGRVCWANAGAYFTDAGASGSIACVPATGGTTTTLAVGQAAPFAIASDDRSVYWTTTGTASAAGGNVMKLTPSCACP